MARYSSLLGTSIEVVYRFFDVDLRAFGKLLGDSGTYIIIERRLDQGGSIRVCQLRLPYEHILKIERNNVES